MEYGTIHTTTSTTRFSSPSRQNAWLCSWPLMSMRFQRSCSTVTKDLWMCAYLDTKYVPRCKAKRSGWRMWGEVFARSAIFLSQAELLFIYGGHTVSDVLDYSVAN